MKGDVATSKHCVDFLLRFVLRWQRELVARGVCEVSSHPGPFWSMGCRGLYHVESGKTLPQACCGRSMNDVPPFPAHDTGLFEKAPRAVAVEVSWSSFSSSLVLSPSSRFCNRSARTEIRVAISHSFLLLPFLHPSGKPAVEVSQRCRSQVSFGRRMICPLRLPTP